MRSCGCAPVPGDWSVFRFRPCGECALADDARKREASIFEKVDILLTLPASGEAPEGIDFTGDPLFNRVWTLLGWPCINVPAGVGSRRLPLGVQVVGSSGEDTSALAAAAWLEKVLGNS